MLSATTARRDAAPGRQSGPVALLLEDGVRELQQVLGGDGIAGTVGVLREGEQPVAKHQRTRRHPGYVDGLELQHLNGPWVRFLLNSTASNSEGRPAFPARTDLTADILPKC